MVTQFTVTNAVKDQARRLGLYGNLDERICKMARLSANITNQHGNRRFENFVLLVEGGVVAGISRLSDDADDNEDMDVFDIGGGMGRPVIRVKRKLTKEELSAVLMRHTKQPAESTK